MQGIETAQGRGAHLRPAQQQMLEALADQRHVAEQAGAHRHRPVGQLVPGQQAAGEIGDEGQPQQAQAQQPVEAARRVESRRVEDTQQMQPGHDQQQIGAPVMQVADQLAECHLGLEMDDAQVGFRRVGPVDEHQQHTRDDLYGQQQQRRPAQAESVGKAQRPRVHPRWMQMQVRSFRPRFMRARSSRGVEVMSAPPQSLSVDRQLTGAFSLPHP